MARIKFMNTEIDNLTMEETLEAIDVLIRENKNAYVVTPNVDHIVKIETNNAFKKAYDEADLILVDGTPLMWISKWYGTPLKEKLTGPNLTERILGLAALKNYSVFFLGAAEGVAELAAIRMAKKYTGLNTVGCYSPLYGFERNPDEISHIIALINDVKPDILVIGMGSPKTEIFLNEYIPQMEVHVSLSIGAAIDFMAGKVTRCPNWVNKIGMEWFYRFIKEPKRMFKRYFIDDITILKLALKYK